MADLSLEIIERFARVLKEKFSSHLRMILIFGSRARNLAKPGSDYDFLIVLKEKDNQIIDAIYNEVVSFLVDYGVDISLKIYSEDDFNKKLSLGVPFVAEIKKSGIKL
jgi:predicted nucleotidyltransferase